MSYNFPVYLERHGMTSVDLIASCWTSAGAAAPCTDDERSPVSIRERVEAVSAAGFAGFGIQHMDLAVVRDSIGYGEFRKILDGNGISIVEVEFLEDWFTDGPERVESDASRAELLRAAEVLGARVLKTGGKFHRDEFDAERLAPHFAKLAEDASNAGTMVGIEPAPFREIQTPQQAMAVIELADHLAGGLYIDIWHTERLDVDFAYIRSIPGNRIVGVEIDDADAEIRGSLLDDTVNNRRFPGEGIFDIPEFVSAVKSTGYSGPWAVELISAEVRSMSVREATRRAFSTTRTFVD
ncbi:sugar phosphate isomerase/epimerase [Rhodococcus ruber]|uniref:Sugar phosphate isomerase/epimerase n=1 Tax=Rhodococcus ruber TaxID=1830 RepID=A0ABT4MEB1_9NOCA|nr:sugar phosphate isomerase/epimerase [Rhodococcus ruber]MCZ4519341.1 sugar phosphate isomerase/epimerase [Rhodococcus ruber]